MQLVPSDVIQRLLLGAVRVHHPREEMIEAMVVGRSGGTEYQLWENIVSRNARRSRFFARVVDALPILVVYLLVTLQVIPASDQDPPVAVDRRGEDARR